MPSQPCVNGAPAVVSVGATWAARWCAGACVGGLAAILAWNVLKYARTAHDAAIYPFGLDYGEGIVWQQMRLIFHGRGYASIDGLPAIVFHYPPLYHIVAGLSSRLTGFDELTVGRTISIMATIVMAAFISLIVAHLAKARASLIVTWIGAAMAGSMVFNLLPIQFWSLLMRIDMLSLACTFAGFYFGLHALQKERNVHIAAILFVAAIYGKQTALAAPVAVFGSLLFLRPKTALAGIATGGLLSISLLALLMWKTDGNFLRHILSYNINRMSPDRLRDIVAVVQYHLAYHIAAGTGLYLWYRDLPAGFMSAGGWSGLRRRLNGSPTDAAIAMTVAYIVSAAPMLLLATKSGAAMNYFIEWTGILVIFAGLAVVSTLTMISGRRRVGSSDLLLVPMLGLMLFQAYLLTGRAEQRMAAFFQTRGESEQLIALMRAAPGPVISDDMVSILRSGKTVMVEPSIIAELTSTGAWDERRLLSMVRRHEIAFIAPDGDLHAARYSPALIRAVRDEYPTVRELAGYRIYLPDPIPAYARHIIQ